MRMNHARRQVSCLVRHHDTGDGRLNPDTARHIRRSIYCALAEVVRDAESISDRLPSTAKALASEIRRDAAWAYKAIRDMATIRDALPPIDLLPDTSSEVAPPENALSIVSMPNTIPRSAGPLTKYLIRTGAYLHLYTLAVSRGDMAIAQDLRAAMHDSLEEIERRVTARTKALREYGLTGEAEIIEQDWAWVAKVRAPISRTLLHDGNQEKSIGALIDEEILPITQDISVIRKHPNPSGMWSKKRAKHLVVEQSVQKQSDLGRAWERLRNGFRPGCTKVILRKEIELHPSGGGGGLGMFEFNETGHIRRVVSCEAEPMVYIGHMRCPVCNICMCKDANKCPGCGRRMVDVRPVSKAHVPLASIPEIAKADSVRCSVGETLLIGAIQEIWKTAGEQCAMIHMSKSESKLIRKQGGPEKNMSLVQWLSSGETSWVKQTDLCLLSKRVFVYSPAVMETTIGQARFCFGTWVDFGDIEISDSPLKFKLGDKVEVTNAKLIRYETAVIGGETGDNLEVSGVGVVVRVPGRATNQTEPMYDIQIGNTVIMHQAESSLRPSRGKRGKPDTAIRRIAHKASNVFDADAWRRYRSRC